MPIRFACSNPACGRTMLAAGFAAGKAVKCPSCGTQRTVPGEPPAPPPADASPVPPRDRTRVATIEQARPPITPDVDSPSSAPLLHDCLLSGTYAFRSLPTVGMLLVCFIGWYALYQIFELGGTIAAAFSPVLAMPLQLAVATANYVIIGYFLRFGLDLVVSSMEDLSAPPNLPDIRLAELFELGARGLGLIAVYVLPVVTIPLLPLGLVAMAWSEDSGSLDIVWAFRSARRQWRKLAVLWLSILLWAGLLSLVVLVLHRLAVMLVPPGFIGWHSLNSGFFYVLVQSLLTIPAVMAVMMLPVAVFRSTGLLTRHAPSLTEALPPRVYIGRTVLTVVACLAFAVALHSSLSML